MKEVADFRVFGLKAVPHSPPRVFRRGQAKNPKLVEWQLYVAEFAKDAMARPGQPPPSTGPLWVRLDFFLKTENHDLYGLVCSPEIVWNGEKREWVKKGDHVADTDNLSKGVLDAMQGVVFGNDVQVCVLVATRRYGPDDAVRVKVWEIEEGDRDRV